MRFDEAAVVDAILAEGNGGLNVAVLLRHRNEVQVFINKNHATEGGRYNCGRCTSDSVLSREAFDSLATQCLLPQNSLDISFEEAWSANE